MTTDVAFNQAIAGLHETLERLATRRYDWRMLAARAEIGHLVDQVGNAEAARVLAAFDNVVGERRRDGKLARYSTARALLNDALSLVEGETEVTEA